MREAWPEISERCDWYSQRVSEASEESVPLRRHGLVGFQLEFKFAAIHFIANRFFESEEPSWLKRLLEAIDKLLKSLLQAIPGGEAIAEFKDIVESLIDTRIDTR